MLTKSIVAPYTGAWIEIGTMPNPFAAAMSLPTRERGLKSESGYIDTMAAGSLPTRERGLKYTRQHRFCPVRSSLPTRERGLKYE